MATPDPEVQPDSAAPTERRLHPVVQRMVDKARVESAARAATDAQATQLQHARTLERLNAALDLIALSLEHTGFQEAADALAGELATRLGAERVSIGFQQRRRLRLLSLSNRARFSHRTDVVRDIEAAMQEAMDQGDTLVFPLPPDRPARVTWAAAKLNRRQGTGGVLTVPISTRDHVVGAITAECPAGQVFRAETIELLETIAALIGPLLADKQRNELGMGERLLTWLRDSGQRLLGPQHLGRKLAVLAILATLLGLATVQSDFRVAARAQLEGAEQRALVAPMSGYIASANVRPGDQVFADQQLAALEDRELQLELTKWQSTREQVAREYRAAVATHDRAQVAVLRAQLDQASAEVERVTTLLNRTRLTAPFNGVVVRGDLSQSLGAPVERGQVLLEIAPLDHYRVALEVDERDVALLQPGQTGQLVLAARPDRTHSIRLENITPVVTTQEGRSFFRVEASLDADTRQLRPNMDGVAKLVVGQRSLLWIWTRGLWDGLSLWFWTHWP
jgi:multidrug resistance efflux pump